MIVLFAAGLVAFVGMTALVIDVGMVYYYSAVSDRVVNATALCAARVAAAPGETPDRAKTAALAIARSNGLDLFTSDDVEIDPMGNNPYVVRITPQVRVQTFFAASFGFESFELPYKVYALGGGTGAVLLDREAFEAADPDEKTPSGFFPSFLFHGSLKDIVMLDGIGHPQRSSDSEANLGSKICQSGQYFSPGDRIWLNGGSRVQNNLKRWLRSNREGLVRGQYRGGCDLPYPGIPTVESRYASFMRSSCLQEVQPGQVLEAVRDRTGWVRNAQHDGVAHRRGADSSSWNDCKNGSSRLVIVPICRAHINMASDTSAGTNCPNLATLPYIYPEITGAGNPADQMKLLVIGLAKVWIEDERDVNTPRGKSFRVIEATFVDYVGSPPDGQFAG